MDPFSLLPSYHGPVLILHGTSDEVVDYHYAIQAQKCYQDGQCHLELIPNMTHSPMVAQFETIVSFIQDFLLP